MTRNFAPAPTMHFCKESKIVFVHVFLSILLRQILIFWKIDRSLVNVSFVFSSLVLRCFALGTADLYPMFASCFALVME